jgi:hypothetical protein
MTARDNLDDDLDLERQREHMKRVEKILYSRTRRLREALSRLGPTVLAILGIVTGVLSSVSTFSSEVTLAVLQIAIAAAVGLVLVVQIMVLAIRIVQHRDTHLQAIRSALKVAYLKASYNLLNEGSSGDEEHAR